MKEWTYELLMKKNTKEGLVYMVLNLQRDNKIMMEMLEARE